MASEYNMDANGAAPDGTDSDLEKRIEALEKKNRSLKAENEQLRSVAGSRLTYRRAAILFVLISATAAGGAVVYPDSRDVLIGIAGTGAFGAVLLGILVQEWLISASVGRAIYETLWQNERQLASRLGTDGVSRYLPPDEGSLGVRLYLSRSLDDPTPPSDSLASSVISVDDHYALLLEPTGNEFIAILERTNGDLPEDIQAATAVLKEAIVDLFELAVGAEVADLDLSEGSENRVRFRVAGSVLGDAARLDHPIRSIIGVALARIADEPVESEAWTEDNGVSVFVYQWHDAREPPDEVSRLKENEDVSRLVKENEPTRDRNP